MVERKRKLAPIKNAADDEAQGDMTVDGTAEASGGAPKRNNTKTGKKQKGSV